MKGAEKTRPVSESDPGVGVEHQSRTEPPNPADNKLLESGSTTRPAAESVEALKSPPPVTNNNSGAAVNPGRGVEDGLNHHEKQPNLMHTSDSDEADDALFRFPKPVVAPRAADNGLPKSREFPDAGFGRTEGRKGAHAADQDPSRRPGGESGQAGKENIPPAQQEEDWDDWEDVRKHEYVQPGGSRPSSPSFEGAHDDGELSSESEYPIALESAVKLPLGKKRWADWADLAKSEYMVLDGPGGESLVFKRASDARDSLSAKSSRGRQPPSFDEPDNGAGSPRLRRNRRQPPSFDDDKPPSSRPPKGASSPRGAVHSAHAHPARSPRKSEAGDNPSQLITRRPLLYRDSRRDYTSEVEDMDATSVPQDQIVHHHHDHSLHEHEDALKYNVEKVLRGQTKYELICPICGALITRKIVIRKKKRRFVSEGDPRWRRNNEITPVDEDGNQTPRSDTSSEFEDASAAWKQGVRPCFSFFFGAS